MATKTSFTPEEWQLLMEGIMSSGVVVTAADRAGCGACSRRAWRVPVR